MAAKKKTDHTKRNSALGAGALAAGAALAAGYYFYGSKDAKKHRKAAEKWANDLKKDVAREIKDLEKVSKKDVTRIVNQAAKSYAALSELDTSDVMAAAKELKDNWETLTDEVTKKTKKTTKKARSTAKKAVKTAKKRTAKKK